MGFAEDGYTVVKGVLADELVPIRSVIAAEVDRRTNELYAKGKITEKHENLPLSVRWAEVCKQHKQTAFGWGTDTGIFSKAVYDLCSHPGVLDVVESIIGPEILVNGDFSVRPKLPHEAYTTLPWHQDGYYYGGRDAGSKDFIVLSIWVPLVDVDERNGCLQVIPGSTNWGLINDYVKTEGGHVACAADVEARGEVVTVPMKAGDLLVFDQFTFHRTLPNQAEEIRWSIDLRFSPADQPLTWHNNADFDGICPCFIARSKKNPDRVMSWEDWNAKHDRIYGTAKEA
ncbi:phytanoyl-CoA dioxygenase family protein [Paenibacillus montanisoli]|uniref:Phytanoyl-CoA dioxygenase family protein n=1 Tax=Paenibacillus montanisoli TaxID=2081970 RepID=A0A328U3E2_9BACL|nr:phytanoyl-CoA dioxygenase family protein [Paenibacillus montanisoli]RAP76572.1 hypothetical protein DL346_14480 [Paenibacillus montanisoli]